MRTGVLLLNIGSPQAPTTHEVRRYLREFLSDPRVIDIPAIPRWLLLNLIILPFRSRTSARSYARIWTEKGSPLISHSIATGEKLQAMLGDRFKVTVGMRYGEPSIRNAIQDLSTEPLNKIFIVPLYPHYASASTGSSVQEAFRVLGREWNIPAIKTIPTFFDHPGFIEAIASRGRHVLATLKPEHILFSYHGLPERQLKKSAFDSKSCVTDQYACCDSLHAGNAFCYRTQCMATSRSLIKALNLDPKTVTTTFQSRLGRTPWIKPYTDVVLTDLAKQGVKRVAVFSPAFVADCLETVEEIGMRERERFISAGGEAFELVPSLNAGDDWVRALAQIITD